MSSSASRVDELIALLRPIGRVDVVGASFSVLKVTVDGQTVDVATPRRERSFGVGHRDFTVESGPGVTLEEDLGRRDFRMNMLARALPSGAIVDPYGGTDDIRARRIDIVTPKASTRIRSECCARLSSRRALNIG